LAIEQAAAEWLARRSGEAWTPADEAALTAWLSAATVHRVAFLRLQAAWQEAGRLQALCAGQAHSGPPPRKCAAAPSRCEQMLQAHFRPRARNPAHRHTSRYATAALLALCIFGGSALWQSHPPATVYSFNSALGEVQTQALADGSHITLASNSQVDVRFSKRTRELTLNEGEAIFDVAKDPQRPFRVAANGYHAVAVGTRFSVRRSASELRVVVTEGTVRLESSTSPNAHAAQPSALLPAGSVALIHGNDVLVRSLPIAEAQHLLDWRDGLLAFRDASLNEVVAEFNRFNVRKLIIADANAGELRIGGNFRWDNEEGFVRLLEVGFPVRADYSGTHIVLHSR
jgi:transmembrane sensor